MFRCFFPDEYLESAYAVNYEKLYQEGVRGLLFDIDNTLVPHGAPADKRAVELFERLRKIGFKSCFLSNYQKAMELLGTDCSNTVFIGDQLFTDIYGAKRAGIRNILVKPIHPKEEIQIVLKRYLERIVLYFYRKEEGTL